MTPYAAALAAYGQDRTGREERPLDTVVNAHMGAVCDRSAVEEPVGPEFQPSPSLGRYVDELGNPLVGNAKKVPGVSKRDTNFN
jgi:hypothetical protein